MIRYLVIIFFIPFIYLKAGIWEDDISPELKKAQRVYSSAYIYKMIKGIKRDEKNCNVEVKASKTSFFVWQGEHSFGFMNNVSNGRISHLNRYECLLTSDKKQLKCENKLAGEYSMFATGTEYVRLTIELDDAGKAVSMHGKKYVESLVPWANKTITEFKCDIQHPAVVKDEAVSGVDRKQDKPQNRNGDQVPVSGKPSTTR